MFRVHSRHKRASESERLENPYGIWRARHGRGNVPRSPRTANDCNLLAPSEAEIILFGAKCMPSWQLTACMRKIYINVPISPTIQCGFRSKKSHLMTMNADVKCIFYRGYESGGLWGISVDYRDLILRGQQFSARLFLSGKRAGTL